MLKELDFYNFKALYLETSINVEHGKVRELILEMEMELPTHLASLLMALNRFKICSNRSPNAHYYKGDVMLNKFTRDNATIFLKH